VVYLCIVLVAVSLIVCVFAAAEFCLQTAEVSVCLSSLTAAAAVCRCIVGVNVVYSVGCCVLVVL